MVEAARHSRWRSKDLPRSGCVQLKGRTVIRQLRGPGILSRRSWFLSLVVPGSGGAAEVRGSERESMEKR